MFYSVCLCAPDPWTLTPWPYRHKLAGCSMTLATCPCLKSPNGTTCYTSLSLVTLRWGRSISTLCVCVCERVCVSVFFQPPVPVIAQWCPRGHREAHKLPLTDDGHTQIPNIHKNQNKHLHTNHTVSHCSLLCLYNIQFLKMFLIKKTYWYTHTSIAVQLWHMP